MEQQSLAISAVFLDAFVKLPTQVQRRVNSMIREFRQHPGSKGLHWEKLNNPRDPRFRSLRVDRSYRAIVRAPESGSTHLLLWVDNHDDAYQWAERHECAVNPETGGIQIYDCSEIDQRPSGAATPESELSGPFARYSMRDLMRLGVPERLVPTVRAIESEEELEERKARLPREAYDALDLLVSGDDYETVLQVLDSPAEPIDPGGVSGALNTVQSRSQVIVLRNERELDALLNAPLAKWRVFLHPTQRRIVERDWNGPVRLLGAAGTGKTVVAMHRAKWLASRPRSSKVLFVTFTKNLAADIRTNLAAICSTEEMDRIQVAHLDSWVVKFLRSRGHDFRMLYNRHQEELWRQALEHRPNDLDLSDGFYESEWEQVVQANAVSTLDAYKTVSRVGRGVPLNRAGRVKVWKVFEEYKSLLALNGRKEPDDAFNDAAALLQAGAEPSGYSSVIVDEAQDLGSAAFRLIRSLVPPGTNDILIAGDCHQRIYGRRAVLSRCGIDIRGRSRKLYLNYRTTEQTRAWAAGLMEGRDIDDLDGGRDDNRRIVSLTDGPEPVVRTLDSEAEQAEFIVELLNRWTESGDSLADVCVVARTNAARDDVRERVGEYGIKHVVIDRDSDDRSQEGVRFATMHRVKGLEFERVILVSVNDGSVPPQSLWNSAHDDAEREAIETMERALLYVAVSRARREAFVLGYGQPSRLLELKG